MSNLTAFYEITFTSLLGKVEYIYVIGNERQVVAYAKSQAGSYGFDYEILVLNSHSFQENIINLCNNPI